MRRYADRGSIRLVIELCSGGDLEGVIEHHKTAGTILDTASIKSFILQTTQGLEYLHDMWIIHRDMKPGNIFISHREGYHQKLLPNSLGLTELLELLIISWL